MSKFKFETFVFMRRMLHFTLGYKSCMICNTISPYFICGNCKNLIDRSANISRERCMRCGKILISEKERCTDCRKIQEDQFYLDRNFAIYPYHLWSKKLLYQWKIKKNRLFGELFAEKVMKVKNQFFPDSPLVPVPPRPNKLEIEGWDQINDLSNFLKYRYDVPIQNYLVRTEKRQQKLLSREERLENNDRYRASTTLMKEEEKPETVVLIDDIYTTGATLKNCAKILKENGIKNVYGITLFIVE